MKSRKLKFLVPSCLLFALLGWVPASPAADIGVAFSPGQGAQTAEQMVLTAIADAKTSIHLAAYSFTSKSIAAALVQASTRGVEVRAVLDKSNQTGQYSGGTFLTNAGIPVRIATRYAIMHNKFMVIDGVTVQTGSFNYTNAAARSNAENVILIRGVIGVAKDYEAEWNRLWIEAEPQ